MLHTIAYINTHANEFFFKLLSKFIFFEYFRNIRYISRNGRNFIILKCEHNNHKINF